METVENPIVVPRAALTPGGLPYPLSSEPVAQGAAAIQALAEAVGQGFKSLPILSAVAGLRKPAYAGEFAFIELTSWAAGYSPVGLFRGSAAAGVWHAYGGPVACTVTASADLSIGASTVWDDVALQITLPMKVWAFAQLNVATQQATDVYITDALAGAFALSARAIALPSYSLIRPWAQLGTYVRPQYFTSIVGHVTQRTFVLWVQVIYPN